MPIFEYECEQCNTIFEEISSGDVCPPCPACHFEKTHKLISRPCVHMQGSREGDSTAPARSGCAGCAGGHCSTCH